jgi:hypothetical protein
VILASDDRQGSSMLFAVLAKFLLSKPPLVQAVVLGLCTGLFVAALAQANERQPLLERTAVLVLVWGGAAGAAYYVGLRLHRGRTADASAPRWFHALYVVVWLLGLLAALLALAGEGGFKVAALAIVPLVLLAPAALLGARSLASPAVAP